MQRGNRSAERHKPTSESGPVPVAVISSSGQFGGAESVMLSLIDGLGEGWTKLVIFLGSGPIVAEVRRRGVMAVVLPERHRWGLLLNVWATRRALRLTNAEIVHAHHFRAAFVGLLATVGTRRCLIWHRHDSTGGRLTTLAIAQATDLVVGVSSTVNESFPPRIRSRVRTVYNAVDQFEIDRADAREKVLSKIGAQGGAKVVVVAARLSPQKGQLDLIDAMPRILGACPELRLALVGSEMWPNLQYGRQLRGHARDLGVLHAVSFVGQLPAGDASPLGVARFVAGSDLLVAPSRTEQRSGWQEGFGLTPLEAMAVGTPVVAYRHGSFPETLGTCASLIDEGDIAALAGAIVKVMADSELRARMAACGRERALRYRSEDQIAEFKQIYRSMAAKEPPLG